MEFTSLSLRTAPGRRDELVDYYGSVGILEASGALAAQVLIPADEPDTVVVTALWADAGAYTAWQNSPRRQEYALAMEQFFDSADGISTRSFRVAQHHAAQ
ncbi:MULTISPECIES: antibiotic biosynthesis monooxygenase family protein [Streptacidiphilus]|uniref:Antibiotic biosynthesis monooxygenase family protein n=1 Tax=Streptacidiphilus cavernicola TaxID=3342716 RepID=A0ABV6V0K5_9ACTN|nr:antibiotic biosynthesis monooxygenase family protein [Streptacidiphilus jeojiense]